ncbi:MAG: hypothetical protein WC840_04590 [Candidatus Peribacteraceae bacterium]
MRVQRGIFVVCLSSVLLASCGKRPVELPAEEVIRRTVLRSQTIDSVSYEGIASLALDGKQELSGNIAASGVIRSGDHAWAMQAAGEFMKKEGGKILRKGSGAVSLSSPKPGTLFLRIERLQGPLFKMPVLSGSVLGKWWRVAGTAAEVIPGTGGTPDPRFVDAYVSAVEVLGGGLEPLGGGLVYRYSVRVSSGALWNFMKRMPTWSGAPSFDARGEVWIDPSTFLLQRAKWTVRSFPVRGGNLHATLEVVLRAYDRSPDIPLPEALGSALSPDTIFDIFSPG